VGAVDMMMTMIKAGLHTGWGLKSTDNGVKKVEERY